MPPYLGVVTNSPVPDLSGHTGELPAQPPRGALDRLTVPGPRALLTAILVLRALLVTFLLARQIGTFPGAWRSLLSGSLSGLLPALISCAAALALASGLWMLWKIGRTGPVRLPSSNAVLFQAIADVLL